MRERLKERLRKARADVEAWLQTLSARERVMVGAAAAAVVLFVVWMFALSIGSSISAREARIEQKIVGRCYASFEEAQAVLRGRGAGDAAALPRVSAVDVLAELADKSPAEVPMRLERIEVTKDKLHLQGTTEAAENVDRIATALKTSRCFADARSGGARRRSTDGKFEFSIDASVTCLETGRDQAGGKGP